LKLPKKMKDIDWYYCDFKYFAYIFPGMKTLNL
jgi:hypothetical protein